jgi:glucose/arabinose dehydrogenase
MTFTLSASCSRNNKQGLIRKLLFLLLPFIFALPATAQNFPAGFSQVTVGTIYYPTSMAVAPDGRIFCTEKAGRVRIVKNGSVLSTPFLTLSVDQLNERGLSSIALDPNFSSNHYVYVYYTTSSSPIHNRLSRFTANGDVVVPNSEVQLLNFETCVNSIHNGGGMAFGPDGKLYLAVGNDNVNSNSQDLNNYKGKLLRINPDGSVPSGNPFTGSESAKRIWAYGFRNPWSIDIQPGTGKVYVNDVGEASWEEINNATTGGKNFGWPGAEGNSSNPSYTNPVFTYPHGTTGSNDGCAVTGGAFFNPSTTNYPSQYTGVYFFIDYCNDWINYLDANNQKHNFATALPDGAQNYMKVGKDGNLYYFSISQNKLIKIIYTNNNAPVVTTQPSSVTVPQGQPASFTVTASGASPLGFQWKKNGNTIAGATASTYTISSAQQSDAGQYSVVVSNTYGTTTSNNATLTVTGFNANPVATITAPGSGTLYRSGDSIHFSGTGTDPEDGNLPNSAYHWIVEFHHDQHIHPGPFIPNGVTQGAFSTTFGETSANVYFRLLLVVTDSQGLTDTAYVDIHPHTSMLNMNTQPSGLQILLEGQPHTTPYSVLAVVGMTRSINVSSPQVMNNTNYAFDHWLHGGSASQNIVISDSDATYTAVFTATGSGCATGTILREFWSGISGYAVSTIPVNTTPTGTSQLTIFEGPSNAGDNYGDRIRGYICPPVTGNYVFWIASDDNSELWLSTNDQPANKVKIAYVNGYTSSRQWTKYTSQQSAPISLVAGNRYYIESLHKEGSQGDNIAVGWQLPSGTYERPIPGTRLSPFTSGNTAPTVIITSPANNATFTNPANITINASATAGSSPITKVEFYEGSTKIGEDLTSPYSYTWTNVPAGTYSLQAKVIDNTNQAGTSPAVQVTVTNGSASPTVVITSPPNNTTYSNPANITINASVTQGSSPITKVEFYNGSTKIGEDLSSPYSFTWMNVPTGTYALKAVVIDNANLTASSAVIQVTVASCPTPVITPLGPTTMCSGSVTLTTGTQQGNIYQWKKDGTAISGATASSYTASVTGDYQVKVINGSCVGWSAPVHVKIQSGLSASITPGGSTSICPNGSVTLYANTCSGYTYQWKKDGNNITGATNSTYTATTAGSYQVKVTQNASSSWSALVNVQVVACRVIDSTEVQSTTGISPVDSASFVLKVFPNPNSGRFTIAINMAEVPREKIRVMLVNMVGQQVYTNEFMPRDNFISETVELSETLPTGVYTLQVVIGSKVENTSVVLSR